MTVKLYDPDALGIPYKLPLLVNVKPLGRVPDVVTQLSGVVPEASKNWFVLTPRFNASMTVVVTVGAVPDVSSHTSPLIALFGCTEPIQMTATDTAGLEYDAFVPCVTVELYEFDGRNGVPTATGPDADSTSAWT